MLKDHQTSFLIAIIRLAEKGSEKSGEESHGDNPLCVTSFPSVCVVIHSDYDDKNARRSCKNFPR